MKSLLPTPFICLSDFLLGDNQGHQVPVCPSRDVSCISQLKHTHSSHVPVLFSPNNTLEGHPIPVYIRSLINILQLCSIAHIIAY